MGPSGTASSSGDAFGLGASERQLEAALASAREDTARHKGAAAAAKRDKEACELRLEELQLRHERLEMQAREAWVGRRRTALCMCVHVYVRMCVWGVGGEGGGVRHAQGLAWAPWDREAGKAGRAACLQVQQPQAWSSCACMAAMAVRGPAGRRAWREGGEGREGYAATPAPSLLLRGGAFKLLVGLGLRVHVQLPVAGHPQPHMHPSRRVAAAPRRPLPPMYRTPGHAWPNITQAREARSEAGRQEDGVKRLRLLLAQAKALLRDRGVPFMEDDPGLDLLLAAKGGLPPRPGATAAVRASGGCGARPRPRKRSRLSASALAPSHMQCSFRLGKLMHASSTFGTHPRHGMAGTQSRCAAARRQFPDLLLVPSPPLALGRLLTPGDGGAPDGTVFRAMEARDRDKEMQRLRSEVLDAQSQAGTAAKEVKRLQKQLATAHEAAAAADKGHKAALQATTEGLAKDGAAAREAAKALRQQLQDAENEGLDLRRQLTELQAAMAKARLDGDYLRARAAAGRMKPKLSYAKALSMSVSAVSAAADV